MIPPPTEPEPGESSDSRDPFGPPEDPCECYCLHCSRVFMSDRIWFQKIINGGGGLDGFWMCPTPNCSGAGFTFDIFPTDPNHPANAGWHYDDDDEEGEDDGEDELDDEVGPIASEDDDEIFDIDESAAAVDPAKTESSAPDWDPAEKKYAELDEFYGEDDDGDIEGEEWKYGLQPGERPPDPPWMFDARKEWEAEQRKFDEPDTRPRELDWSDREPPSSGSDSSGFTEDDIPF